MTEPTEETSPTIPATECRNCRFFNWEEMPMPSGEGGKGRCYRYPRHRAIMPQQNHMTRQVEIAELCNYPLQMPQDWCGEFILADQSAVA